MQIVIIIEGFGQPREAEGGLATIKETLEAAGCLVMVCPCDDEVAGLVASFSVRLPGYETSVIGYSYGGGKSLQAIAGCPCPIDKLVLLDPVTRWRNGQWQNFLQVISCGLLDSARITIPPNVGQCLSLYQRNDWPRGVRVQADARVREIDGTCRGLKHQTFPGNAWVQQQVSQFILAEGIDE